MSEGDAMRQSQDPAARVLRHLIPERIPWFAASLYDRIAQSAISGYYREVAGQLVHRDSRELILDVGTGPGYLPIEIARRAPGARIVAVDSSRAMIRIARKNSSAAGVADRIHFVRGDGNRLKFEDNLFDLVISTGSLHAWKCPVRVINEFHRVLKEGGTAWILDPAHLTSPEATKIVRGKLGIRGRLAHLWASVTSRVTPPYAPEEIAEIVRRTRFQQGKITKQRWLSVELTKGSDASGPT
ncbi:MAG: class I SAM-dependent methyltransferase [Thermodesulfobacteriota bacterium]